jgi:hypothetical protein
MSNENKATVVISEVEQLKAQLAALQAKNDEATKQLAEAKALADSKIRLAVGDSGGVSIYGLQQFPVTLTVERWHQCLDFMDKHLDKFVDSHETEIKTKTAARQAERDKERANRQPRSLGMNGPVKTLDQDAIDKMNAQFKN